jgi:hypothetical protein
MMMNVQPTNDAGVDTDSAEEGPVKSHRYL